MNEHAYEFSCYGDVVDIQYLNKLMIFNGIPTEKKVVSEDETSMGITEIIIALISSAIIPKILDTIVVWMESRKKELEITDMESGIKIHLTANNGKSFSKEEIENIKKFFEH